MMYKDFIRDFAIRTKSNLNIIKIDSKTNKDCYEVTQMINSLLGLLIFPQQKYYKLIPEKFPNKDIKIILEKSILNYPNESISFNNIIRHMRNAISHDRLEIYPYGPNEIEGMIFRDKYDSFSFELNMTVDDLNVFLSSMCDFIINFNGVK